MYTVIPTEKFQSDIEYYEKKKRFKHIDDDVNSVVEKLEKGELVGTPIDDLGELNDANHQTVKVRIANTDTKVGKSNGYRIIYYAIKEDFTIYLLSIYYKKEDKKILTDKEIIQLVNEYCM